MYKRARAALIGAAAMVGAFAAGPSIVGAVAPSGDGTLTEAVRINNDRIKFQTKDPVDLHFSEGTFQPGEATPWHNHPGFVLVAVRSGTVTFFDADCNRKVVRAGEATTESGGPMRAVNLTGEIATVRVAYVVPHGSPRSTPAQAPDCAA